MDTFSRQYVSGYTSDHVDFSVLGKSSAVPSIFFSQTIFQLFHIRHYS